MYTRILVPLDGSKFAERAIPYASELAKIFGACLILLHVLDPHEQQDGKKLMDAFTWQIRKTEADLYLESITKKIQKQLEVEIQKVLIEGPTAESIIDYIQKENVDLLAICTHGSSGLSRWNTSSTFQKVINKIYQHVLVVRSVSPSDESISTGAGLYEPPLEMVSEHSLFRRILVPIDTSLRAECALPTATSLASGAGASIILTSVLRIPEMLYPPDQADEYNRLVQRIMQIGREATRAYLTELQGRLPGESELRIVEENSIQHAIHSVAEQTNASLVVFCAHGYTGRHEWPYGSVVQNYIEYGSRPVLIVQDVPRVQVRPTLVEQVASKYGRR